ncbi:MAG TPA: class I SAM-dependent DNA methyltransferase [Thermodesulfobacteriota bacterium]
MATRKGYSKTENVVDGTTASHLSSIIKSARDIMRKDKGLNGDLDRLPQLTWIMFLKFLDDVEKVRETETVLSGRSYAPIIEYPYRWHDWAADPAGITGNELLAFITNDEVILPNRKRGQGLLPYLRSLQVTNGRNGKHVLATVFRGVTNRMLNGYLLRDVINKINEINFTSSDQIHILSHLYESLIKELRDAAGDSGEFYTPRPVVEFMTQMIDPKICETVLDPAAGTGGFLVESYIHLKPQCKTTQDYKSLQEATLFGIEAKSLPYLLCQMNLLLHDVEHPNIDPLNALRFRLGEIGDKDRVDVILTNPPFGAEEEPGILANFPEDKRTNETALLFLQLIMRKLRKAKHGKRGGRCAIVVPNGTLFGDRVALIIRKELLQDFNVHTIVRLPKGVFAPYTDIQTNLLFFERSGPTSEIWYYELPLPQGRKQYTKTNPLSFDEFKPVIEWWNHRKKTRHAWRVSLEQIVDNGYNLDIRNPDAIKEFEHLPPEQLIDDLLDKQSKIMASLKDIRESLRA